MADSIPRPHDRTPHTPSYTPSYTLIDEVDGLYEVKGLLEEETAIGVDLECDSMFHYQERVCLIQIATTRKNFVIDPISIGELSPLAPVFLNPRIEKVLHGADYDIRSLYRDFRIEVRSLFDTQIAARFLGLKETGLASLLRERFSVLTDKKYQKKDWSQRPLPDAMIHYAVQDIHYLLPLADMLKAELKERELLFCVEEENELLSHVRPDDSKNKPLFLNFKGAARLGPRSLGVLQKLLSFRDREARRRDCPHFKVLGNKPILEMARNKPISVDQLGDIEGLSAKLIRQLGQRLIGCIREGLNLAEERLPVYPKKPRQRPGATVAARVKTLKTWRDRKGKALGVDPALVLTNAQIHAVAEKSPETPGALTSIEGIRNWQVERFGPEICAALQKTDLPK